MITANMQQVQPDAARDHHNGDHHNGDHAAPQPHQTQSGFIFDRLHAAVVVRWPSPMWFLRLGVYLALAGIPVLSITAHVFGWVSMYTVTLFVLPPLLVAVAAFVLFRPDRSDRVMLAGFLWGLVACAGYDASRLPTVYGMHLWGDFFGSVGGWAIGSESTNYLVGYLWRYIGDGGGIAVTFFALAATLRIGTWSRWQVLVLGVGYAVFPVWAGLILTDLFAPAGHELYPISATTLIVSLVGHLIYGLILGYGYWISRAHEAHWPFSLTIRTGLWPTDTSLDHPDLLVADAEKAIHSRVG